MTDSKQQHKNKALNMTLKYSEKLTSTCPAVLHARAELRQTQMSQILTFFKLTIALH